MFNGKTIRFSPWQKKYKYDTYQCKFVCMYTKQTSPNTCEVVHHSGNMVNSFKDNVYPFGHGLCPLISLIKFN